MGFAVWSVATIGTGLARSYDQIQIARAGGRGRRHFEIVALTILMDLFPRALRARVLAAFFLAVPLGRLRACCRRRMARTTTWQTAFLAVGAPGLLLALVALVLPDPVRGSSEEVDRTRLRLHEQVGPSREDYIDLMVNSSYTYSVFGITFSSFALAGLVYWSPTFLTVAKGMTEAQAEVPLGLTLLGAAFWVRSPGAGWPTGRGKSTRGPCSFYPVWGCSPRSRSCLRRSTEQPRLDLRWLVPGRSDHLHEHRAVLHDHRGRRDAQHAASGGLRRRWRRFTSWETSGRRP